MPPPINLPSSNKNELFFGKLLKSKLDASSSPTEIKHQEKISKDELLKDTKFLEIQKKALKVLEKAVFRIQGTSKFKYDDLKEYLNEDEKKTYISELIKKTQMMKKTLGEWNPLQFSGFGLKEKQAIEKWDRYTDKLESVKNKLMFSFNRGVSVIGNKTKVLFKGMVDVGACLGRFLTGTFKIGWKIADKLMYFGFGPAWSWTKNVLSTVSGIGKWILTTGWEAITFIGTGLKTIFSFGLDVIKTTSSYILGGAAKFFGWYFKNLFTTLFSPTMWLINIPIFVGISFAIFSVFEGLFDIASGPVYTAVSKTFAGVIDKLGDFGSWLWEGAKAGFDWLVNVHFGDKTVKEYFNEFSAKLGGMIEPWVGSGSTFGNVIKWISETYTWLKGDFGEWYSKSASVVSSLINYVKEMPGRTLVGKLFNKLEPYSVAVPFLGSAMHFIQKKYGFVFNGETKDIESALNQQKTVILQSALEREIIAMKKSGKSESYIKDELQNKILPNLQESVYARVSESDQNIALNNAYSNSDRILAGKNGLVSNDVLKQRVDAITTLTNQLALINSGQIDYNDETSSAVRNSLRAIHLMNNNEVSDRLKSANSGLSYDKEFADSTIDDLKEFSNTLEKSKQVPSYTDFIKNDPLDNLNSTQKFNIALAQLSTTTGSLAASAFKVPGIPIPYKIALGAGGALISSTGQKVLNDLDDAGITGRGGSQMNSRTDIGNFKSSGATIKTGPDQASELISQYLGTFAGKIPNNSEVKTQMRSDVIDLLNNPYIADDTKRKSLIDFYLDNPTYNTLFDKTNKIDAGGGNLSVSLRYAMEQLLTTASISNRAKKMALGGVLAKDMNKIIPLDMAGQDFIRNQLESFSKNKDATIDINKKKDQKILTNIINETVYQADNYEMYTIRQLTNGTLGAL